MHEFIENQKKECYEDLLVEDHILDLQGWMDPNFATVFENKLIALMQQKPDREIIIVEVGSWKGLSTITMGNICKKHNAKANIIAIDTWLGAPEFWTWGLNDPTRGQSLKRKNGYPSVYYTFLKNVKLSGLHDTIVPLPLSSICAADVLKYYKIAADIIYVDAAHEYLSVLQDVTTYFDCLVPQGMMFGDDYSNGWPGVNKAVHEFVNNKNLQLSINSVVWSFEKK